MTVLSCLRDARAKVAKGWCQGKMRRGTGDNYSYDIMGAINYSAITNPDCGNAIRAVKETFRLRGYESDKLNVYNDAPERTQKEVLDLFDDTIQRVERGE